MKMSIVLGIVLSILSLTLGLGYAEAPTAPALVRSGGGTCAFQTSNRHFLTAVGGGGRITNVIHTDATNIDAWEKFSSVRGTDLLA